MLIFFRLGHNISYIFFLNASSFLTVNGIRSCAEVLGSELEKNIRNKHNEGGAAPEFLYNYNFCFKKKKKNIQDTEKENFKLASSCTVFLYWNFLVVFIFRHVSV